MADRYWVGGSGNWDAASTANWSASSGGASGASVPTSADNVIFDANSNVGTGAFTVTVAAAASCLNFTASGLDGAMTFSSSVTNVDLNVYGSMSLPATNFNWAPSSGLTLTFRGTSSNTLTTNGVTLDTTTVVLEAVGGTLTLGSAVTLNSTRVFTITRGTFSTSSSNYTLSAGSLASNNSNTRTINLNASTVSLTGTTAVNFATSTNLTFTAGTSTITCSNASPTFTGGDQTFYNVTFSSTAAGTVTMTGANIFNNLTQSTIAAVGIKVFSLGANITVNGTLTLNNGTLGGARVVFRSSSAANIRTVTVATLATTADVDFYNIAAAGASIPWSGTRLGDCAGNSNITFVAGVNKYWNLAAGGNWNSTAWALTSGGAVAAINYPLPQDTAIIENTGLNTGGTITMNVSAYIGSLDCSGRTNAFNLSMGNSDPQIFGSTFKLSSALTMSTTSGSPTFNFSGRNITQTFDSAGIQVRLSSLSINVVGGTLLLAGNTTVDLTNGTGGVILNLGTLDLAGYTLTAVAFSSSNSDTRSIAFGTGKILLTGNSASIFSTSTATGLTVTGTPLIECNYTGSAGTRTITMGNAGEANAISVKVTGGSDALSLATTNGSFKDIDLSGFTGTLGLANSIIIWGNFDIGGATALTGSSSPAFVATSGTKTINFNNIAFASTLNLVIGASTTTATTFKLTGGLNMSNTSALTFSGGTFDLNGNQVTTGQFISSVSTTRSILFGSIKIYVTGNNATIFNMAIANGFSYTGTPDFYFSYAGSTGTRTINFGGTSGATESNSVNMSISSGGDVVSFSSAGTVKNLSYSGYTGNANLPGGAIYGDLTLATGMTISASSTNGAVFAATSGTQTVTSNGVTIDRPVTINAPGAIVQCQDALTLGSTRTLTMTNGTLQLKAGVTSTVGDFATSGTNQKYLQSTLAGTQATLSDASGTVSVSYLTIQDINATGGATWVSLIVNSNINNGNNSGWTFYYNTYNSSIGEFVNGADDCATNIIGYSFVSESANANDLFVSRYLWTIIDNGETANWQTITNSTSVWTDVNNP